MNFDKLAQAVAGSAGRPLDFIAAVVLVVVWGVSGPIFGYSDTWQLVINTGTTAQTCGFATIITFLMVFLIQNTQNRDTDALQVKIDELLRVTEGACLALLDLEEMKADELERIKQGFVDLSRRSKGEGDDPSRSSTAGT